MKNKQTAIIITVIMIIISIPLGASRSLNRKKKAVEQIFYSGIRSSTSSLQDDLNARIDYAVNFTKVAENSLPGDKDVNNLRLCMDALKNAGNVNDKKNANSDLTEAVEVLYNKLKESEIDDRDLKKIKDLYTGLNSRNNTINYEAEIYNAEVLKFNKMLNSFPGVIAKGLGLVRPLDIY